MIFERTSHDIFPQMKILNRVITILMHFFSLVFNWRVASHIKPHVVQQNAKQLIASNCYRQDLLLQIFDVIQTDIALQKPIMLCYRVIALTLVNIVLSIASLQAFVDMQTRYKNIH